MRLQDFILTYACNSLWQVPLLCGMAWIAGRLLHRLEARMQYVIWILSLVIAALLPLAGMVTAQRSAHQGATDFRVVASTSVGLQSFPVFHERGVIALPKLAAEAVLILYCIALLASLSRFIVGLLRVRRLVQRSRPAVLSDSNAESWAYCRAAFTVGAAEVRELPGLAGPVTCGWKSAVLLVPGGFLAACEKDDLLVAFAHEAAHIERRDFLTNSLLSLITLPVAYHPATWFMHARLAESRELICDEMASARMLDAGRYAASLFRLASRISSEAAGISVHAIGIFDANILEKRMTKLKQQAPRPSWQSMVFVMEVTFLLACCLTTAAFALAPAVIQNTSLTGMAFVAVAPGERVFHVGNGVTAPTLTYSVDPEFPAKNDKAFGFKGICVVNLVVGKDGTVEDVRIVRSLEPAFDKEAVSAVRQYRFKPGLKNGNPVAVSVNVEVSFQKY